MRTLVPNEMLKNPAVSILSAPNSAGPLTVNGSLMLAHDPTLSLEAATKQYADTKLTQAGADARYDGLGAASTAVANHVAAADPHPVYLTQAEADARYAQTTSGLAWPLLAPDGSAAAPSYAFASNSGTGIYSNGVAVGITTGGTFRAFFGGSISFNAPLQFSTDNSYDIGAPSSARPRSIYAATSVFGNTSVQAGSGTGLIVLGASGSGAWWTGSNFGFFAMGSGPNSYVQFSTNGFNPQTPYTKDLGSSSMRWQSLFLNKNIDMTGSASRILADWSSSPATRAMFQTSTTNSATAVSAMPSGTGGIATFRSYNNSVLTDASYVEIYADATLARLNSGAEGTGTVLPLALFSGTTERMRLTPSGTTGSIVQIGGSPNERIRNPANAVQCLSVESSDGYIFVSAGLNAHLSSNAYWDGTNWLRFNTGVAAGYWGVANNTASFAVAAAGANPISWTTPLVIDSVGTFNVLKSSSGVFVDTTAQNNGNPNTTPFYGLYFGGGPSSTGEGIQSQRVGSGNQYGVDIFTAWAVRLSISNGGLVTVANNLTVSGTLISLGGNGSLNIGGQAAFGASGSDAFTDAVGNVLWRSAGGAIRGYIDSSGQINTNGDHILLRDGYGLQVQDSNTHIFSSGRAWYFDQWNGGWMFRNSMNGYAWAASIDGAGNINAQTITLRGNALYFSSSGTISWDGTRQLYQADDHQFVNHANSVYARIVASAFTLSSSLRFKRNLTLLDQGASLRQVMDERARPLTFAYLNEDQRHAGFAAEDLVHVVPEAVALDEHGDPFGINYSALVPILWGAVRELSARLAALEGAAA